MANEKENKNVIKESEKVQEKVEDVKKVVEGIKDEDMDVSFDEYDIELPSDVEVKEAFSRSSDVERFETSVPLKIEENSKVASKHCWQSYDGFCWQNNSCSC